MDKASAPAAVIGVFPARKPAYITPTAIPSGMLCSVTAKTIIAVRLKLLLGPSVCSLPTCRWGIKWSSMSKNNIPIQKPINAGRKDSLPILSDCSIAGISRLQIDAATITPAAKPASERCTISLSDFFIKNTHAEPSVVPIKGISMPIKVSITSPSLNKKFVSCQLNYTTTVGIMIAEAKISLWLYHLLLCGGVNTACEISNSNKLQEAYSN